MASSAAGIIFSSLNNNTLSRLTSDRTVAAIPFACRYRLIDFALSNMVNANMTNIYVVANYKYRSLLEHLGSGKDWDLARREGGITFISPFQTAHNSDNKMFSTHMEALKSMKEYINEIKEEYVVLMDSDTALTIDITDVIRSHESTGASVTIVTSDVPADYTAKNPRAMIASVAGKVTQIAMSASYDERHPELALGIYVMKTSYLRLLIDEAEAYDLNSFTLLLLKNCKSSNYMSYKYTGFAACVSSFLDYYKYSMELVNNEKARESLLWKKEAPIFTRVHNSAPTKHYPGAKVENSMIADECSIEGTVINSVIFRDVTIEKGAVVENCVLFHGTHVCKNAHLNCIVSDKDVIVTENVNLSGNHNMPFYIQKGRKI
ncbi:MAG: glucose-1-phosphate adenylyltransferase subunit GlgD [Clostridia bacterium]|nr:glucose-1-phosphate adenylyltransferase subunit GlgD [Clostridia bacterium]